MADIRKVRFIPIDSEPYEGWINFDRVLYAEAHGIDKEEKVPTALVVMDTARSLEAEGENFRIAAKAFTERRAATHRPSRRKSPPRLRAVPHGLEGRPGAFIQVGGPLF
jgi:hypothetical protein